MMRRAAQGVVGRERYCYYKKRCQEGGGGAGARPPPVSRIWRGSRDKTGCTGCTSWSWSEAPSWRSGSGQVEVGGARLVRPRPHDTKLCICHDARDSVSSPALEVASKEARGCHVKSLATCWRMHADLHYWWVDLPPIGGHHYDESDYDFVVPYRICCSILSQLNHHQITSSSNLFLIHYQWLDALKCLFPP